MKSRLIAPLAAMTLAAFCLVFWPNHTSAQGRNTDLWEYHARCLIGSGFSQRTAVEIARGGDAYHDYEFAIQSGQQAKLAALMRCFRWPTTEEWEKLMDMARDLDQRRILKFLKWKKKRWEEWKKKQKDDEKAK